MQANLIFNPSAGFQGTKTSSDEIQAALKAQGFQPVYRFTESEEDLDHCLVDSEGLIVVAGGDGTLRAVTTRLLDRENLSILHLPMGTANNIAAALGIPNDPIGIIKGLDNKRELPFDVGKVTAPWGVDYFLEGTGFGFFADILVSYDPARGKSVLRSMKAFAQILSKGHAYHTTLTLNGEQVSGDYLLVELLNTTAVGPRLKFAPNATPHDGLLDVVCIHESDRNNFLQYLASMLSEDLDKLETVVVRQAQKIELDWDGFALHVDAELRPPGVQEETEEGNFQLSGRAFKSGRLIVETVPGAVNLWLPGKNEG